MSDKPAVMELEDARCNPVTELSGYEEGKVLASSMGQEALREPVSKSTSAGVTLKSFKRRNYGSGIAEFDRPMEAAPCSDNCHWWLYWVRFLCRLWCSSAQGCM